MIMTPKEIFSELDKYIIGQDAAKKSVAIALRNRWRRMQLEENLRNEVTPKNILMIGPTGVGKTEIARRLAKLAGAPFIKVEATKFTEVGYVGRDVETIVRDLVKTSMKMQRESAIAKVKSRAEDATEERILDILLNSSNKDVSEGEESATRQIFRKKLREGDLDDKIIDVDLQSGGRIEIMGLPGMEDMTEQLQGIFSSMSPMGNAKKQRKLSVKKAKELIENEEANKLLDEEDLQKQALDNAEQNGIVFLDELDKVCKRSDSHGGDVSREGVQRDLLPLIEGTTVMTKYGMVKTDHILFIASGAFHMARPSDLIAELQGRLPIRVELKDLTVEDFKRILTEPAASLTEQYIALMKTEGLNLSFTETGIEKIAEIAYQVNQSTENIGARRLYTVMEKLLESVSYVAGESIKELEVDAKYVEDNLSELAQDQDLSRYIL